MIHLKKRRKNNILKFQAIISGDKLPFKRKLFILKVGLELSELTLEEAVITRIMLMESESVNFFFWN